MNKMILYGVTLVCLILLGGYWLMIFENKEQIQAVNEPVVTGQAMYQCAEGHIVAAVFTEQGPVPEVVPGEPPTSNASVRLRLDGAQEVTLPQALSADGARYANADESLVFWSKGAGAMVLENDTQTTYRNCIVVKKDSGFLPQVYLDEALRFTLRYPADYTADNTHVYKNFGHNPNIFGTKFAVPDALASGTNLSKDSYISIEHIKSAQSCTANDFLSVLPGVKPLMVEDGGVMYSVASSTDAGAGNRYEEYVYGFVESNPCLAIRYFIHYSVLENYDPGTVAEFDKSALLAQFDSIRQSVTRDVQIVASPLLHPDAYPLYSDLLWGSEFSDDIAGMRGYSVKSDSVSNITDISAVSQPFEKYYNNLLVSKGWVEDMSMAAGGPGAAVIAYKKGNEFIVLQYSSSFGVNNANEPAQCPCAVTFTVFSGNKE